MSKIAMAVTSRSESGLNPDAPLFIPAAYHQVEDFSPEWWNLVQTSTWFRDYWLRERHENFAEDADCFSDLFPDVHDLPEEIDEFSDFELQLEEAVLQGINGENDQFEERELAAKEHSRTVEEDGENDAEVLSKTFNAKSTKVSPATILKAVKHSEKSFANTSPKGSPRPTQQLR